MARRTRVEAKRQTRERILDAAREHFARSGFAGTSIDVIAEDAGYSKGAFYSNFGSKEDIFLVLLERHLDTEVTRGQHAIAREAFEPALKKFVDLYTLEDRDQDWCLLSVEFALHAARSNTFRAHYSRLYQRYYDQVAETLGELAGLAGSRLENANLSATKFVAFRRGLALDRAAANPSLSPQDVTQSLAAFLRKVLRVDDA